VPVVITATNPVMVAQYITNASKCANNYTGNGGDPDMVYLSAVEQTINKIIVSPVDTKTHDATNYINVVIKTVDIPNFTITNQNGVAVPATFTPINSTYSYAQIQVATGYSSSVYYTLSCTSGGFNAVSYGYASSESYAYNAGTNLVDLLTGFNVQNLYGTGAGSAACKGSQFYMSITLAFKPLSINWDFASDPNLSPNAVVTQTGTTLTASNVLIDSVQINGVWLYTYQIPTPYIYNATGSFNVTVNAVSPTPDGCNGVKTYTFPVNVVQGPNASFTFTTTAASGCLGAFQFTDASVANSGSLNSWLWGFVDGTTTTPSALQNPSYTFTIAGNDTAKLRVVRADGCYADTSVVFKLSSIPVANFTFSPATPCAGKPVTFTDGSTIATGSTIAQWIWNYGDASGVTATTNAQQTHSYSTANTYSSTLQVKSTTGCPSAVVTKPITVYANPTTDFSYVFAGCVNGPVNYTALPSSSPVVTGYSWDYGDATALGTIANPTHTYVSPNTYNVALTVTTAQGCTGSITKPVTVAPLLSVTIASVVSVTYNTINFAWTAVVGATGYLVSTDGVNFVAPSGPGLTHTVTGLTPNQKVTLYVKATGTLACAASVGSVTGTTLLPDVGVFVPNTFTPNGDGKNDVLKVYGNYLKSLNLQVFNQWGQKIYSTTDVNGGWDGTYNGKPQPVGVYIYVLQATLPTGAVINKKGSINLIR
jgi:gliding motility-associated-like protein